MEAVERDLRDLSLMLDGSADLEAMVLSPVVGREKQKKVMATLAEKAKFHQFTKNFLMLLAENRRLREIRAMIAAVQSNLSSRRGEVSANVQVATALTAAQTKALQNSLSKSLGHNVTLDVGVDKDLIGGMVVTVGSRMIDDSIKRKLERLRTALKSQSNMNANKEKEVG